MRSAGLLQPSSKQRLEEFRSKLESNFVSRQPSLDHFASRSNSIRKTSPFSRLKDFANEMQRTITPKKFESPKLNHYRDLSYFKSHFSSPKPQVKFSEDLFKKPEKQLDFLSYSQKKKEKLSDVLSIETLSNATKIITRGGTRAVPKIYASQLKEFCQEVLARIS